MAGTPVPSDSLWPDLARPVPASASISLDLECPVPAQCQPAAGTSVPSFSEFARLVSAFVRSHCTVCIVDHVSRVVCVCVSPCTFHACMSAKGLRLDVTAFYISVTVIKDVTAMVH